MPDVEEWRVVEFDIGAGNQRVGFITSPSSLDGLVRQSDKVRRIC